MKYCLHCGANLEKGTASFCIACGRSISSDPKDQLNKIKSRKYNEIHSHCKKLSEKREKTFTPEEIIGEPLDDGYDGYYNDVLPPDIDQIKEGVDKELIKNIAEVSVC